MIYEKEINGVEFTFVCESWHDRRSWGHKVTLYKNNTVVIGTAKIRYYNRTWERYQYQSVIKSVIFNIIAKIKSDAKIVFKNLNNYKVMTKKRAAEFSKYLQHKSDIYIYNKLYEMF